MLEHLILVLDGMHEGTMCEDLVGLSEVLLEGGPYLPYLPAGGADGAMGITRHAESEPHA